MSMPVPSVLLAAYGRQQIVKDRNYAGLIFWAASNALEPIPKEKPGKEWVRLRLLAERIPQQTEAYVQRTLSYFAGHPNTQVKLSELMNPYNSEAMETNLATITQAIIAAFIASFAAQEIADPQVNQWLADHGF